MHSRCLRVSKSCIAIYEGHKNDDPLYERLNNAHHGFMKVLKMSIFFFMSLSKIVHRDFWGLYHMQLLCTSASTTRITVL